MVIYKIKFKMDDDPPAINISMRDTDGVEIYSDLNPADQIYRILYKAFLDKILIQDKGTIEEGIRIPVSIDARFNIHIKIDQVGVFYPEELYAAILHGKSQIESEDKNFSAEAMEVDPPEEQISELKTIASTRPRREIKRPERLGFVENDDDQFEDMMDDDLDDEDSDDDSFKLDEIYSDEDFRRKRLYRFSKLKELSESDLQPRDILDDSIDFQRFDRVTLSLDQVTSGPYTAKDDPSKRGAKKGRLLGEPRNQSDVAGYVQRYTQFSTLVPTGGVKNSDGYLRSPLVQGTGAEVYTNFMAKLEGELVKQYPRKGSAYKRWLDRPLKKGKEALEDNDDNYKKFINRKLHKAEWLHSLADSLGSNPLAFWNASAGTHAANTHMAAIETAIRNQRGVGVEVQTFLAPGTKIAEWYKYTVFVRGKNGEYDRIVFHIDAQERWYSEADYNRDQQKIQQFLAKTEQVRRELPPPPEVSPPIVTDLKFENPRQSLLYPPRGGWPYAHIGLPLQSRTSQSSSRPSLQLVDYTQFIEGRDLNPTYVSEYNRLKGQYQQRLNIGNYVCSAIQKSDLTKVERAFKLDKNSINYCNHAGEYPLLLAMNPQRSNFEIASFLLRHGANLHVTDANGNNVLHLAIEAWIELGKKIGHEDKKQELLSFIEDLLRKDSKLTSKLSEDINFDKQTPMDLAIHLLKEDDPVRKMLGHADDYVQQEREKKQDKMEVDEDKSKDRAASAIVGSRAPEIRSPASVQQGLSQGIPGLVYQEIPGDGHCLYNAVALYLGQSQELLRVDVANYMKEYLDEFQDFLVTPPGHSTDDYIQEIREGREWADHVEIEVLMRRFNRPIVVIGADGQVRDPSVLGRFGGEPIFVFYNGHNHYDALLSTGKISSQDILKHLTQLPEHSRLSREADASLSSRGVIGGDSAQGGEKRSIRKVYGESADVYDQSESLPSPPKKRRTDAEESGKEKKEQKIDGKEQGQMKVEQEQKEEKKDERKAKKRKLTTEDESAEEPRKRVRLENPISRPDLQDMVAMNSRYSSYQSGPSFSLRSNPASSAPRPSSSSSEPQRDESRRAPSLLPVPTSRRPAPPSQPSRESPPSSPRSDDESGPDSSRSFGMGSGGKR